jgi:hypothetical protein
MEKMMKKDARKTKETYSSQEVARDAAEMQDKHG